MAEQLENPSDEFVKFCASKVFDGSLTPNRREYFAGITKQSFIQLVNDRINERLKSAMSGTPLVESIPEAPTVEDSGREGLIETTAIELEGFYIVKSLLRDVVDLNRLVYRDTQSYFGILLDDNNRKPIARLYFNRAQKYIGLFDEKRKEERIPIQDLNDIYQYGEKMRKVFAFYEGDKSDVAEAES